MQADIVIMTTEILRNVMYKVGELDGVALDQSAEDRLADVALIVLDEVGWQLASVMSGTSSRDADRLTDVALTMLSLVDAHWVRTGWCMWTSMCWTR